MSKDKKQVPEEFLRRRDLSGSAYKIGIHLFLSASDLPTQADIRAQTGLSDEGIILALKELARKNIIKIEKNAGPRRRNIYQIQPTQVWLPDSQGGSGQSAM